MLCRPDADPLRPVPGPSDGSGPFGPVAASPVRQTPTFEWV